jgi:predicted transcriptional regulator
MDNIFFEAAKLVSAKGYGSTRLLMYTIGLDFCDAKEFITALQDEGILERAEYEPLELLRPIGFY